MNLISSDVIDWTIRKNCFDTHRVLTVGDLTIGLADEDIESWDRISSQIINIFLIYLAH